MKLMRYTLTLFISGLLLLSQAVCGQEMLIRTIAGDGTLGFSGDGAAATAAELYGPTSIAVNAAGDVYFVDYFNHRVRKIDPSTGDITTVAGNGNTDYNGDTSLATSKGLNPTAIALDRSGNLYITDNAFVVRKVTTTGIMYTIAGTSDSAYSGDGGAARYATFTGPRGIAVDTAGNIYVADAPSNAIRKISTAGIISTIAGNGVAGCSGDGAQAVFSQLDSPYAVAASRFGDVFISDYKNNVIRRIDANGFISQYAGSYTASVTCTPAYGYSGDNGAAATATLNRPVGLSVDSLGNLYIADANNNVIRKVTYETGFITTIAGNGTSGFGGDLGDALGANLRTPFGTAVDNSGSVYIGDADNQRVRKVYLSTLATNNVFANSAINVYPNPTTGQVTIPGLTKADKVCIYDLPGRQMNVWTVPANGTQTYDITSLTPGMYLLQVTDAHGNKKAVSRLVKE